jgi:hypothetical protein
VTVVSVVTVKWGVKNTVTTVTIDTVNGCVRQRKGVEGNEEKDQL